MTNIKPKIIIVLGPTASGKSSLAVQIAKQFKGEVISADSRQIYQELNIGSNKTTIAEQDDIKHYLLDTIKPDQDYSMYDWQASALTIIKKID